MTPSAEEQTRGRLRSSPRPNSSHGPRGDPPDRPRRSSLSGDQLLNMTGVRSKLPTKESSRFASIGRNGPADSARWRPCSPEDHIRRDSGDPSRKTKSRTFNVGLARGILMVIAVLETDGRQSIVLLTPNIPEHPRRRCATMRRRCQPHQLRRMDEYPSPSSTTSSRPEDLFVDRFAEVFGVESACLLAHEFPVLDILGNGRLIDYALRTVNERVAFEIDGLTWHVPDAERTTGYEDQLLRQNSLVHQGWRVFRWTDRQIADEPESVKEQLTLFLERHPGTAGLRRLPAEAARRGHRNEAPPFQGSGTDLRLLRDSRSGPAVGPDRPGSGVRPPTRRNGSRGHRDRPRPSRPDWGEAVGGPAGPDRES